MTKKPYARPSLAVYQMVVDAGFALLETSKPDPNRPQPTPERPVTNDEAQFNDFWDGGAL